MAGLSVLQQPDLFSSMLYDRMRSVNAGVEELELYEFRYALDHLLPKNGGWADVAVTACHEVESLVNSGSFYSGIRIKPRVGDQIVLDEPIVRLTVLLFVGLVTGEYSTEWVNAHFYFDIRGFYFLHRTTYFTEPVLRHLGNRPFKTFGRGQARFARSQDVGYKEFKAANAEIDVAFMDGVEQLIVAKGTPVLLAIAGPTAAGKTEIVDRLRVRLEQAGRKVTAIEMDNFLTDRDDREKKGIYTLGRQAIHLRLLTRSLEDLRHGRSTLTPRYDFVHGTSSHDLDGDLKPGGVPLVIEPADVLFIEGNFPFLLEEVAPLIGIKVVYLTDDPIRLKRKWKRDIDYRKKYEPTYFRNRFFREQFLMAEACYRPQMERCDLVVDTTGAALWASPDITALLEQVVGCGGSG